MPDTIREKIIQKIENKFERVRRKHGYNTDIGTNILRVRKNLDPNELPAVVIWPGIEEIIKEFGNVRATMPVTIEGIELFGSENPSIVAERILGDLITAATGYESGLDPTRTLTGGYAESIEYVKGGTETYPEGGEKAIGVGIQINIVYITKAGDPYSQPD